MQLLNQTSKEDGILRYKHVLLQAAAGGLEGLRALGRRGPGRVFLAGFCFELDLVNGSALGCCGLRVNSR